MGGKEVNAKLAKEFPGHGRQKGVSQKIVEVKHFDHEVGKTCKGGSGICDMEGRRGNYQKCGSAKLSPDLMEKCDDIARK
jgi:hypothetical protein